MNEDDCLALLSYVSKHRNEPQSINQLSEEIGIPVSSLREMIIEAEELRDHSYLSEVAYKYGFDFKIYKGWNARGHHKRNVIDVVKRTDWY